MEETRDYAPYLYFLKLDHEVALSSCVSQSKRSESCLRTQGQGPGNRTSRKTDTSRTYNFTAILLLLWPLESIPPFLQWFLHLGCRRCAVGGSIGTAFWLVLALSNGLHLLQKVVFLIRGENGTHQERGCLNLAWTQTTPMGLLTGKGESLRRLNPRQRFIDN